MYFVWIIFKIRSSVRAEGCSLVTPDCEWFHSCWGGIIWNPWDLRCDACFYYQINLPLVSLGKSLKDEHPMDIWTLIIFSLGEVYMYLQLL